LFKWICLNDGLPLLQKFQEKYGFVDNKGRNNFPCRNFSRFKMEFELKFREISMRWKKENWLEKLGNLEFDEI
jgi:hypothetical protein